MNDLDQNPATNPLIVLTTLDNLPVAVRRNAVKGVLDEGKYRTVYRFNDDKLAVTESVETVVALVNPSPLRPFRPESAAEVVKVPFKIGAKDAG